MKLEIKRFNELSVGELYEVLRVRAEIFIIEQESSYNDLDGKDFESVHITLREGGKLLAYLRVIKSEMSYADPSMGRTLVIQGARGRGLAKRIVREGMKYIIYNI